MDAHLTRTARYIAGVQTHRGAIPWFHGGIVDPWDHVEAAMGLTAASAYDAAEHAYRWLAEHQRPDGTWLAAYQDDAAVETRIETNFVAYAATGVWHHYLATRDRAFAAELWPMVDRAIDFVLGLQAPSGEIYWAQDLRTGINKDALVTGCSSIYMSLGCALALASVLGHDRPAWARARVRLRDAVASKPQRFDRTWPSKARYSMDWFYPVLCGVVAGAAARERLAARWDEFVEPGLGCRCVADQPWVTVAETCELAMACVTVGWTDRAQTLLEDVRRFQAEDGSWWTGYAIPDDALWPDERPTWTAGAVLLAADTLHGISSAHALFRGTEV